MPPSFLQHAPVPASLNLAIMQPYFLPYIGYFQLISAVDLFIIYDNIQYTKKGWINRNRLLHQGRPMTVSLPLKKAPDLLEVGQREISADFHPSKLLNQIIAYYRQAPHFATTFPVLEHILHQKERNLFRFIYGSLKHLASHLGIKTPLKISSEIAIDHTLKHQAKVIALCTNLGATQYINAIGGTSLYDQTTFQQNGITLKFLQSHSLRYKQFDADFVPWLSIVDVLMFNPIAAVQDYLATGYDLIDND